MNEDKASCNMPTNESQEEFETFESVKEPNVSSSPDYTQEQVNAVKKINKCKDLYEVLGLSKDATDDDIKKSYRKLALLLHPDKNKAPGANEAFKMVGKAFATLSDSKKREEYNQQKDQPPDAQNNHYHQHSHSYYEEDPFNAEDIFNTFFGGTGIFMTQYPRQRVRTYHQFRHNNRNPNITEVQFQANLASCFRVLFIISFVVLFTSWISYRPAMYNLKQTKEYSVARRTSTLGLHYFVKPDYNYGTEYDTAIEQEYLLDLRNKCVREMQLKESSLNRAHIYGTSRDVEAAQKLKTPTCTKYNNIVKEHNLRYAYL